MNEINNYLFNHINNNIFINNSVVDIHFTFFIINQSNTADIVKKILNNRYENYDIIILNNDDVDDVESKNIYFFKISKDMTYLNALLLGILSKMLHNFNIYKRKYFTINKFVISIYNGN